MELTLQDRAKLVDALLNCDSIKSLHSRKTLVRDLPLDVQNKLHGGGTTKEDVDEIVRVCAQYDDGLETLLERVRYFEGESIPRKKLDQVAREIASPTLRSAAPLPVASAAAPPSAQVEKSPVQVFFSYSHKDEALRDELSKHLAILKRAGVIKEWHDRQIPPGSEWAGQIDDRMNHAHVILLLISSDFLASDYCHEIEMKRAMERHELHEAVVIPIILRPCDWNSALFGKLQALPKDAKPVTKWGDQDEAFLNVAQGIRKVVEKL
jgi:hypothetical protein